jgi:hypothetical protein
LRFFIHLSNESETVLNGLRLEESDFIRAAIAYCKGFRHSVKYRLQKKDLVGSQRLSLRDAEILASTFRRRVPFLDLPELLVLEAEINRGRDWIARARKAINEERVQPSVIKSLLGEVEHIRLYMPESLALDRGFKCRTWIDQVSMLLTLVKNRGHKGPKLSVIEDLLKEAHQVGIPLTNRHYSGLIRAADLAKKWLKAYCDAIESRYRPQLPQWQELLTASIPIACEVRHSSLSLFLFQLFLFLFLLSLPLSPSLPLFPALSSCPLPSFIHIDG